MDQSLLNLSCTGFLDALGSRSPAPGGGGASALVGALSASLGHMVCEYTVGKKRYARFEDDVRAAMSSLTRLGQELQALVDEDASAYSLVSEAYALGKDDPARAGAVNRALDAAYTPGSSFKPPLRRCALWRRAHKPWMRSRSFPSRALCCCRQTSTAPASSRCPRFAARGSTCSSTRCR